MPRDSVVAGGAGKVVPSPVVPVGAGAGPEAY